MPKQSQRANINALIKGIITEANPLNFPSNASVDELNFEIRTDGTRIRRLGMEYEDNNSFSATVTGFHWQNGNVQTYRWDSVTGDSSLSFITVQMGSTVFFYDAFATDMSNSGFKGFLDFSSTLPSDILYSFAAVDGYLIIASGQPDIVLVSYNAATNTFSSETHRLLTRDLWGMEEVTQPLYETDSSFRGALTPEHTYNLYNQSWGIPRRQKTDPAGTYTDAVAYYIAHSTGSVAPSNSEQIWTGLQFQPGDGTNTNPPFEAMYENLWYEAIGGTTKSAKGYFIIDVLDRSNSRIGAFNQNKVKYPVIPSSYVAPVSDQTLGGSTVVCDFAGRIFYGGFNGGLINGNARSPILNNYLMFTQLVKSKSDFFKCYQDGDPTSRDTSDVVDTDGGFVRISGAKNIVALQNLGNHLVVFAENGVWGLTGGNTDSGFSATNYKVTKISSFGCIAVSSIVTEGSTCYYWASDGVFTIGQDQFGVLHVTSLTNSTIQSLYQNIPQDSKLTVQGIYDPLNSKARWIYQVGSIFTSSMQVYELIYDSLLSAWTKNRIFLPTDSKLAVLGLCRAQPFFTNSIDPATKLLSIKYFTVKSLGAGLFSGTWSYYHQAQWLDWKLYDGVGTDASAFILAGTETTNDPGVDKQIPYLMMYFERTEKGVDANFQPLHQSSCLFQMQWDFSNSVVSNRWSPQRQAYRYKKPLLVESLSDTYDNGLAVLYTKNKVRGKGKAFSLYLTTEPLKACHILGWNITVNVEQIT